jgi:hypothetical protein
VGAQTNPVVVSVNDANGVERIVLLSREKSYSPIDPSPERGSPSLGSSSFISPWARRSDERRHAPSSASAHEPRQKSREGVLAFVVIPLIVGLIVVLVLTMTPWGNEQTRRIVVSQGNQRLTGSVASEAARQSAVQRLALECGAARQLEAPGVRRRRVEVQYSLLAALRGEVVVHSIVLDTPVVVLDKRPGERWNFQSLMKPSTTPKDTTKKSIPPSLSDITIRHGRFLYRRPWLPDTSLPTAKREEAVAKALDPNARRRTMRVPGGYQRVLDYHDIDARLPSVRIGHDGQPTAVEIGALKMLRNRIGHPRSTCSRSSGRCLRVRTHYGGAALT